MTRSVIVGNGTLFAVAAEYLGDATQWNRIAALSGLSDPWIDGLTPLTVPDVDASAGGGVGFE